MRFTKGRPVAFTLLSTCPLTRVEEGASILNLITEQYPVLRPTKLANQDERYVIDYSDQLRPEILNRWGRGLFAWRRTKPSLHGYISTRHVKGKHHSTISVVSVLSEEQVSQFPQILRAFEQQFHSDLAVIHSFGNDDLARARKSESVHFLDSNEEQGALFLGTWKILKCLPDLWWGTFFGPPYIEMFGRERLLTCPAFAVENWKDGIWIQLSENPLDDPDELEKIRVRCKSHLGEDAFYDPYREADYTYRVPDFSHLTNPNL